MASNLIMAGRHKWHSPFKPFHMQECTRCNATRETIAVVGKRYHRALRSYVTADGIRYTGCAPVCTGQPASVRPIVAAHSLWMAGVMNI